MLKPQSAVSTVQKTRLTDREKSAPKQYPATASSMLTTSTLGMNISASLPPETSAANKAASAIRFAESFISTAVNYVSKNYYRAALQVHMGGSHARVHIFHAVVFVLRFVSGHVLVLLDGGVNIQPFVFCGVACD